MKSNKLESDGTYTHTHAQQEFDIQSNSNEDTNNDKKTNSQQQGTANPNIYRYCIAGSLLRSQHNKIL